MTLVMFSLFPLRDVAAAVISLFLLILLYYCILYPYFLSPLRTVPGPSSLRDNIFWGQFLEILRGEVGVPQREWLKRYGPVVRVVGPIGIERLIFVTPEALNKILVADWLHYPRPSFWNDLFGIVTGEGLLAITGNEHRQMKRVMSQAFATSSLVGHTNMYYDSAQNLIDVWRKKLAKAPADGLVINVYDWVSKAALDIICATSFGYKANSIRDSHDELAVAYEELIGTQSGPNMARFIAGASIPGACTFFKSKFAYNRRHWLARVPTCEPVATMIDCMHRIEIIARMILDDKIQDVSVPAEDTESKHDIISILLRARNAQTDAENAGMAGSSRGSYKMTDQMMMDQVLTFLGAGHETTASGMAWTLYLLAAHPDVQCRLREEVTSVFRSETSDELLRPDHRVTKDLKWLDCVIMESLRLFPPVPMAFRQAKKTCYIDGVLVPKGTFIYVPIRVVNMWKDVWGEDAEEFNPSRWHALPPTLHPTMSFLSFLVGPHACIGKTMALMEMSAVLGALVSHFEFSLAQEGQVPQPTAAVTLKPRDGMPLRIRRL